MTFMLPGEINVRVMLSVILNLAMKRVDRWVEDVSKHVLHNSHPKAVRDPSRRCLECFCLPLSENAYQCATWIGAKQGFDAVFLPLLEWCGSCNYIYSDSDWGL